MKDHTTRLTPYYRVLSTMFSHRVEPRVEVMSAEVGRAKRSSPSGGHADDRDSCNSVQREPGGNCQQGSQVDKKDG